MPGDERLRLFVALPLPRAARERVVEWQRDALAGVPDTRVVPPENLHLTLAFLGSRPASDVAGILDALREAAAAVEPPSLTPLRYRETRSVGMIVFDDADGRAVALATLVADGLERLGVYERERRPWLPHLTVLRFRRPPRLSVPPPAGLDAVSPSEVGLYHSVLRPSGAQYGILESVALGG